VKLKLNEKYWIIIGSNGVLRLQLGILDIIDVNGRSGVNEFIITYDDKLNDYFSNRMIYYVEGDRIKTINNKNIFEYYDLESACLEFFKSCGFNLCNTYNLLNHQYNAFPEKFL